MKISLGSDHRGVDHRKIIATVVESLGHEVVDHGTKSTESCDYPDVAVEVADAVAPGGSDMGILICGTGIGMMIAANKVSGARAVICCNRDAVKLSRQHNDANVLCLAGNGFDEANVRETITTWLATEFEGGRHARRIEKVAAIEAR
jgi:ribose 5-phosphate isomerase B